MRNRVFLTDGFPALPSSTNRGDTGGSRAPGPLQTPARYPGVLAGHPALHIWALGRIQEPHPSHPSAQGSMMQAQEWRLHRGVMAMGSFLGVDTIPKRPRMPSPKHTILKHIPVAS